MRKKMWVGLNRELQIQSCEQKNKCQTMILHVKVYQSTKYYQPSPIHVLTRVEKRLKVTQNGYVADITHVTRCGLQK